MLLALCLFGGMGAIASAQVRLSAGIALPGVRIGINIPGYPDLRPVPGYPVYYAPQLDVNLFFYDGQYWLFTNDQWYASNWYNGPWYVVAPYAVPDFILRIPIRYYRRPPMFFHGWNRDGAPRWGEHWGRRWQQRRPGWDRWNRRQLPRRAPLPRYQRDYSHGRYPNSAQRRALQDRYYRYRRGNGRPQRNERGRRPPQRDHRDQRRGGGGPQRDHRRGGGGPQRDHRRGGGGRQG